MMLDASKRRVTLILTFLYGGNGFFSRDNRSQPPPLQSLNSTAQRVCPIGVFREKNS